MLRTILATTLSAATILTPAVAGGWMPTGDSAGDAAGSTATPIRHVVVIFRENVSFDHYFATYPHAANPPGVPAFHAAPNSPRANGLNAQLLQHNPRKYTSQRLSRDEALTCDRDHGYTAEQKAFDGDRTDRCGEFTGQDVGSPPEIGMPGPVMDYSDGHTVTAPWNYAQRFALSDDSFDANAGSLMGMFDFAHGEAHGDVRRLFLDPATSRVRGEGGHGPYHHD